MITYASGNRVEMKALGSRVNAIAHGGVIDIFGPDGAGWSMRLKPWPPSGGRGKEIWASVTYLGGNSHQLIRNHVNGPASVTISFSEEAYPPTPILDISKPSHFTVVTIRHLDTTQDPPVDEVYRREIL